MQLACIIRIFRLKGDNVRGRVICYVDCGVTYCNTLHFQCLLPNFYYLTKINILSGRVIFLKYKDVIFIIYIVNFYPMVIYLLIFLPFMEALSERKTRPRIQTHYSNFYATRLSLISPPWDYFDMVIIPMKQNFQFCNITFCLDQIRFTF